MLRRRGWLAGRLSVTRRYCIKTAKPILKLFRSPGSAIILTSSVPCADAKFQWKPFSGAVEYTSGAKKWRFSCDCRRKSPFITETARDRSVVLWNVNRKSRVPDWTVSFSMTLSDPYPGFKVTVYLQVECLKNGAFLGTKLLKNPNRKSYTIYRMEHLSMTLSDLWPRFQAQDIFFDNECLRNDTRFTIERQ